MLSPGEHWRRVPKDSRLRNLHYRQIVLAKSARDPALQHVLRKACREDLLFYVNTFCIAAGTLVVTDRGFVPIELVTSHDKVWDGKAWAAQEGSVFQGVKPTIAAYGIHLTPDHEVWTIHGWQQAGLGYDRQEVRSPYRAAARRDVPKNKASSMALPMRLRKNEGCLREQFTAWADAELRLCPEWPASKAWLHQKADLRCLAQQYFPVYDLVNCGPRRAFTVLDANGELLLVHNCYLFEPRPSVSKQALLPFCTYPFQDKAFHRILQAIEIGEDLLMIKSRDMGASWMCLTAMHWMYVFHPGCKFSLMSRNERLVDKSGDPDSLFWKVDHLHSMLPGWLKPQQARRKLSYENLDNGSTITGEATTGEATVGGRATAVFIDEFSRIDEGYELLAGTADVSACRIFNFTFWGTNNAAFKMSQRSDVAKLYLPWWEHPEKSKGLYRWNRVENDVEFPNPTDRLPRTYPFVQDGKLRSIAYDIEDRRRNNPREMAQNWDMDPQGGAYQFFDKVQINDLQRQLCCDPYLEGELAYDAETGQPIDFLVQKGGKIKLWMMLDAAGKPKVSSYGLAADIGWGTGATNSCASAIDLHTGEKVLEVATPHLPPDRFAGLLVAIANWLRGNDGQGAYFAWEMQGPGIPLGKRVVELGYRNIYYRVMEGRIGFAHREKSTPGWVPTPDTKRVLYEEYRTALYERSFINRSAAALEETLFIVHLPNGAIEHSGAMEGDDPTGARVNHGDRVVPDALCWKLRRDRRPEQRALETKVKPGSLAWRRELVESRQEEAWSE